MRKRRAFFPTPPHLPEHQIRNQRAAREALRSPLMKEHPSLLRARSFLKYLIESGIPSPEAARLAVQWVEVMDHLQRSGCTDQRGEWRNVPTEARLRRCPFGASHRTTQARSARIEGPLVRNEMRGDFRCTDPACAGRRFEDVLTLVKSGALQ